MSIFEPLDCVSCGACCKHQTRLVLTNELSASEDSKPDELGFVPMENKETSDPNRIECINYDDIGNGCQGCVKYGADNYPVTCSVYPFVPTSTGMFLSATCVRIRNVMMEYISNEEYRKKVIEQYNKWVGKSTSKDKIPSSYQSQYNRFALKSPVVIRLFEE